MGNISVFIITKNEASRITKAIESVRNIADELIVVDSNSTDNTVEIAKNLGAHVVVNDWPGYLQQKALGESLCSNKWILNIDADEELSHELQNEIAFIFTSNLEDRYTAYKVKVVLVHRLDANRKNHNAPYISSLRLYNKDYWGFIIDNNNKTHDRITKRKSINATTFCLSSIIWHNSYTSIEQLINKLNFYSSEQADDLITKNIKISVTRMIFEIPIYFFKTFFFRKYYVFGFNGFIDAMILAFFRFARLAKTRERRLQNNNKHD